MDIKILDCIFKKKINKEKQNKKKHSVTDLNVNSLI